MGARLIYNAVSVAVSETGANAATHGVETEMNAFSVTKDGVVLP